MIPVQHPPVVPPMLAAEYARNPAPADPNIAWQAFGGRPEITAVLEPVQRGICPYCEETLTMWGCHIDHVVPKSRVHGGTFLFTNLVLSCINSDLLPAPWGTSCGHSRGNEYDAVLFIKPTEADCSDYFSCRLSGELRPAPGLSADREARATYMIRELNLKCERLNRRRRDWITMIQKNMAGLGNDREAIKPQSGTKPGSPGIVS
jgi:uncharacterized protein (TIGR02646 family)